MEVSDKADNKIVLLYFWESELTSSWFKSPIWDNKTTVSKWYHIYLLERACARCKRIEPIIDFRARETQKQIIRACR